MRTLRTLTLLALCLLSAAAWASPKIAVLDVDRALTRSELANSYREKIKQDFAMDEKRLQALADEGTALQERLKKEADFLSEEEQRKLMTRVKDKYDEYQQLGLSIQKLKQQREQQFVQEVRPRLDSVLKALVKELKLEMIIDKRTLVYVEKELDITEQVIERLNQQQ